MALSLPEKPQPREMAAFRTEALAQLDQGLPVTVHAAASGQLPLAWMQLLIATAREAGLRGTSLTIINPTFAFLFSFEALGLQPERASSSWSLHHENSRDRRHRNSACPVLPVPA